LAGREGKGFGDASRFATRATPKLLPVVRYQYEHGGQLYEGDRLIFSGQSVATSSPEEAKRFAGQFEVGMPIPA
jgi:hypothetical protein